MGQRGFRRNVLGRLGARVATFVAMAVLTGYGSSCGGDPSGPAAPSDAVIIPRPASLLLQVADVGGAPIPVAMITAQGELQTADGAGRLLLEGLPAGRFVARVEAPGFAPASVVVELPAGAHGGTEVRLHPLGDPIPLDADKGGTIEKEGVRVVIPPASLLTEDGEYVTGMVEATVVPLDPTIQPLFSPGPLEGVSLANGGVVGLDSGFMAEVSLWKEGRRLKLAPGAKATLVFRLPDAVAAKHTAGDVIEAWWFDLDTGRFREDGVGTIQLSDTEPGKLNWVVEVEHFTWWNCDVPWNDRHCFELGVVDPDGAPVGNVSLSAVGLSYFGYSSPRYTDENGVACIDIKRDGTANLFLGGDLAPLSMFPVQGIGLASACDGSGAPCTTLTVTLPTPLCTPGSFKKCLYSGPPEAQGVGICKAARAYCNTTGTDWLACSGEVTPLTETCHTPYDDNCDGIIPLLDDANACTADICTPNGAITHPPVNTSDNNKCTHDGCNSVTGIYHTPLTLAEILDMNACTIDWCEPSDGPTHALMYIDDGDPCTTYTCDPASGPSQENTCTGNPCDGAQLDDGNACTIDACDTMTGDVSHTPIDPDDQNPCTQDSCDPALGISYISVDTSDGNICTDDACDSVTGEITHTLSPLVNDNDPCTIDDCDPGTGQVTHTPSPFVNDNNACTNDTCDAMTGQIQHTLLPDINDNDLCTVDTCNAMTGQITHTPNAGIDDNNPCTQDICNPATGSVSHPPIAALEDNNACTVDTCDPATGQVNHSADPNINDNNACTIDTCNTQTGQINHTPDPQINDNDACTVDTCNTSTGQIAHTQNPLINDNNACTIDTCNTSTGQINHTPNPAINDNNPCTVDTCNTSTGAIAHPPNAAINDNNACTVDTCNTQTGAIAHTANPAISDSNPCTQDNCDPATGTITHPPIAAINDNNACTTDSCNPSTGQVTHTPKPTNDNNACTVDICDPATGQVSNPPHAAINDGDPCTQDVCNPQNGMITHPPLPNINDNNACTVDSCNSANGQVSHTQIDPNDNNDCTLDYCDPATGIHNDPIPGIDDNNPCTIDSCDPQTGLISHTPDPSISDNNVCTIDACNTVTGQITHTPDPAINDNNACTTDTCHPQTGIAHAPIPPCSAQPNPAFNCGMNLCNPSSGQCVYYPEAFLEEFANNSKGWTFTSAASPANQWAIGSAMSSIGHTLAGPDPSIDWTAGGDNGVAGVAIGGNAITQAHGFYYITSPIIDLSSYPDNNANNDYPLYLNFYRWLNSAAGLQNFVEVYDGSSWVTIDVYNGLQNDASWKPINLEISAFKSAFFQVRFGYNIASGAPIVSSWNIDHVRIARTKAATCP